MFQWYIFLYFRVRFIGVIAQNWLLFYLHRFIISLCGIVLSSFFSTSYSSYLIKSSDRICRKNVLKSVVPEITIKKYILFITRGQFWPSGIVVACVCVFVSLCVNHLLVRTITRDLFKLRSPNLKHRCKRRWLRSLLLWGVGGRGVIDLYLQGQIYLQSQNLPHFELVRVITHHPFKLRPPNLDQRCKTPWLRCLLFWGLIELDMSN